MLILPAAASAQDEVIWPFDVTREDLAGVRLDSLRWIEARSFTGGIQGRIFYANSETTEGGCRAIALIAAGQLRDVYMEERESEPVRLELQFRCADLFAGSIRYDGVNVYLDLLEPTLRRSVYQKRERGLASIP